MIMTLSGISEYVYLALSKSFQVFDCDYGLSRRRVDARGASLNMDFREELRDADERRDMTC